MLELNQAKSDDTNIKEDKARPNKPAASRDKPLIKKSETKDTPSTEQGSEYLPKGAILGLETVGGDEELEALRNETSIQAKASNKKLSDMQITNEGVERAFDDTIKKLEKENYDMSGKTNALVTKSSDTETGVVATEQGSGYLSKGSSIGMGVIDGDEEVTALEKIRRLEARLEASKNEMRIQTETSNKKLSDLQAVKEGVEKAFADTKKRLEKENKDLSDKINALESELSDTEARAVAAEKKLDPVKKELLKAQLSEIKAQQELYKLKIDNLKQEEE